MHIPKPTKPINKRNPVGRFDVIQNQIQAVSIYSASPYLPLSLSLFLSLLLLPLPSPFPLQGAHYMTNAMFSAREALAPPGQRFNVPPAPMDRMCECLIVHTIVQHTHSLNIYIHVRVHVLHKLWFKFCLSMPLVSDFHALFVFWEPISPPCWYFVSMCPLY